MSSENSKILSELDVYDDNYGNKLIKEIEARYSFENDMIRAVSQGNYKALSNAISAEVFMTNVEKRSDDAIRNLKNYMIIFNTLLRKGAEVGNVHPFYIHGMSSDFAKKIENCKTLDDIEKLWNQMAKSYCDLVKTHYIKDCSPLVQSIVMLIDADLTADLTLSALSKKLNVNASYLSTLFRRDTGYTLTEYVNNKRIKMAKYLLETTNHQVQQISHECGILDVNYFVKIFKKHTGKTPKKYRESL